MARALRSEPNYGYEIIGYLDDDPAKVGKAIDGVKIHKGVDEAGRYIESCNITDVVITMPGASGEKITGLVNKLQHKANRILIVPDVFGTAVTGTNLLHFFQEQTLALELKNNLDSPFNIVSKRVFDYMAALLLTLLLIIPLIAIALAIRLTSSGPAIYKQPRVGRRGKEFMCYKFRTMYADADERLARILKENSEAREEWERQWKLTDDPRITPIGNFLRVTSLDELPQLFNVLKGQMSLVGPRPVTQEEIENYYRDSAELCFSVPPGITGLWQVSGRSNTSYDYRIALDSWYVRNWNMWLDIVILLKTVSVVIKMEGAR
jgi:undecaprenyl-phosphate galactose phosphotransferase